MDRGVSTENKSPVACVNMELPPLFSNDCDYLLSNIFSKESRF